MKSIKIVRIGILFSVLMTGIVFSGCEDKLEVEDLNNYTDADAQTPEGIKNLQIGMFFTFANNYNYFWGLYLSHCAGEYEFIEPTGEGPNHFQMWNLNYTSTNAFITWLYSADYQQISLANRIIDYIENNKGTIGQMPQKERERILGSAYFMRGYSYFQLLHTWGNPYDGTDKWGVVLTTEVVTKQSQNQQPRAKVSEVYAQIISDFTSAKQYLPKPIEMPAAELGTPTKAAASAWIGKTYVFQNKYNEAIAEFKDFESNYILASGADRKGLLPKFGDNFHAEFENGVESLFEIQFGDLALTNPWQGGASGSVYQVYIGGPDLGRGNVNIPAPVFYDFQPYDQRRFESRFIHLPGAKKDSILENGNVVIKIDSIQLWDFKTEKPIGLFPCKSSRKITYAPKKYINRFRSGNNYDGLTEFVGDENQMITRVAEVYYLYAEALIEGNGDLNVAREYLNKITRRAYGFNENTPCQFDIVASDAASLRTHLRYDKRKEFIGEMIRWYDMVRWDGTYGYSIVEEVGRTGRGWSPQAAVWPVPIRDQTTNLKMEQYPGY